MADIKQAAKWMQDGKRVKRPHNARDISVGITPNENMVPLGLVVVFVGGVQRPNQDSAPFCVKDLLADDWQLAD